MNSSHRRWDRDADLRPCSIDNTHGNPRNSLGLRMFEMQTYMQERKDEMPEGVATQAHSTSFEAQALHVNLAGPQKVVPPSPNLEGKTTVMLRNVPAKLVQQRFMKEINAAGFLGKYDFMYLPMGSGGRRGNRGFAFVNFTMPEAAEEFKEAFHGSQFRDFNDGEPLIIAAADLQGFEENAAHFIGATKTGNLGGGRRAKLSGHMPLFFRPLPAHLAEQGTVHSHQQSPGVAYSQAPTTQIRSGPAVAPAMPSRPKPAAAPKTSCSTHASFSAPVDGATAAPALQTCSTHASFSAPVDGGATAAATSVAPGPEAAPRAPLFCAYCGARRFQEHRFCVFCGAPSSTPVGDCQQ